MDANEQYEVILTAKGDVNGLIHEVEERVIFPSLEEAKAYLFSKAYVQRINRTPVKLSRTRGAG